MRRLPVTLASDIRRVITRFFDPGREPRIRNIIERISTFSGGQVDRLLDEVFVRFQKRHDNIASEFDENYRTGMALIGVGRPLAQSPPADRILPDRGIFDRVGGAFQSVDRPASQPAEPSRRGGAVHHESSRYGRGARLLDRLPLRRDHCRPPGADRPLRPAHQPVRVVPDKQYDKPLFRRKLKDIGVHEGTLDLVLDRLADTFTSTQLEHAVTEVRESATDKHVFEQALYDIRWLVESNYQLELPSEADASEVVIFPQTSNESHGIEDLRMVRFVDDDGSLTYFGTCSAYDGNRVLPQLIETRDFLKIGVHTINGACAQNKGMALFPRRIGGHYVMCSRIDGENLYIMFSDIVHFWETASLLQAPKYPWEFVQVGNCGSPLETPEGWLLFTHGVGPMRTYGIGAMLLDLNDPLKVIGCLDEPLITPTEKERDGYVPNVAYSCGAMIHDERLYLPFATSDRITRMAMVSMDSLLNQLIG